MAEPATTNTRPARTRAARPAATTAKAPATTKAKAAPAAKAPAAQVNVDKFTVELEHVGSTKQYEKFAFPDNMKGIAVGNVYAPLGTETVKVLIVGAGADGTPE